MVGDLISIAVEPKHIDGSLLSGAMQALASLVDSHLLQESQGWWYPALCPKSSSLYLLTINP